ncbi:MAG: NUDIX domain-containing protein [Propionibacteriaceae bacterium]|nr:NUDIX domain-containing protein [Propionibacteriaceae bacterium]
MRVIGVASPVGAPIFDFVVGHGEHPDLTLWNAGYVAVRPLSANLVADDITVVFLVRPSNKEDRPQRRRQRQFDSGVSKTQTAQRRQRIAAYAMVASPCGLLGTVCSPRTNAPGVWMLPGGGLDPHESPSDAVLREIYEETGQDVRLRRLLALQSDHWIGFAPDGTLEDFHALRIIYSARCDRPTPPVVHDHAGTTEHAAWVGRSRWRCLPWTAGARALLTQHLKELPW